MFDEIPLAVFLDGLNAIEKDFPDYNVSQNKYLYDLAEESGEYIS